MENLRIQSTKNSPEFNFTNTGSFAIKGRILTDNAVTTFEPVFNWISNFHGSQICFDISLDYINTSASMQLFSLLRQLDENCEIEQIKVIWHYEHDDEDHLETGEFYQEKLNRVQFEFIENKGSIAA